MLLETELDPVRSLPQEQELRDNSHGSGIGKLGSGETDSAGAFPRYRKPVSLPEQVRDTSTLEGMSTVGKDNRKFLAERADRISRSLEEGALTGIRLTLSRPEEYVNTVIQADDDGVTQEEFTRRLRRVMTPQEMAFMQMMGEELQSTPGEDAIQTGRWAKNRVVLVCDSTTAEAVRNTDWGDTVIPGEVLRRLPYPDPMVILPEPFSIPNDQGLEERYEAFMVLGVRPPRKRCSSAHPDCQDFVMHFLGRIVDPVTGRPVLVNVPKSVLNPTGPVVSVQQIVGMRILVSLEDATMRERQDFAANDLANLGPISKTGFVSEQQALDVSREMTALALSLLVYLVTDDLDSTQMKLSSQSSRDKRRKTSTASVAGRAKDTTVVEVGFRVGASLRAAPHPHGPSRAGEGKRTVAPHVRRAHIHTFRRGPRSNPEKFLKWLPPLAINTKPGQKTQKTQIHFP